MSNHIKINYQEVYKKTAEIKAYINDDLMRTIDSEYKNIQSMLDGLDSASNAKLKEVMELNRHKSLVVSEVFVKLASFIENSSKQVEINEAKMSSTIDSGTKSIVKSAVKGGKPNA